MAIDELHDRIRKLKSPLVLVLGPRFSRLPEAFPEDRDYLFALLEALKDQIPAVRFSFGAYSMLPQGLDLLRELTDQAKKLGYFVILDGPELSAPALGAQCAEYFFGEEAFVCDALTVSAFIGADALTAFLPYCREKGKNLFVLLRSANRSASQVQDLLCGSRHVHDAVAELTSRCAEAMYGKCGYSQIGGMVSATSPESLRTLRSRHNRLFFLVDGMELPSGNAKNASLAMDRFGHGGAICVGPEVTDAWQTGEGEDPLEEAKSAAQRLRKNLARYVAIL